jgi:hypothetical protein
LRHEAEVPARVEPETAARGGEAVKRAGLWFSDFDSAEATSTHFVITPSGDLDGWAKY